MRSIIFADYMAKDTMRLGPTFGVEHDDVVFLGNLTLTLWDCGGQDKFMATYFESQKHTIFRNVEVLIYVFDVETVEPKERKKDLKKFRSCLEAVYDNSKKARIFCLVHKMDLIPKKEERVKVFKEREKKLLQVANEVAEMKKGSGSEITLKTFGTSIWDETLYKAWSNIVYTLVPNVDTLEAYLHKFCKLLQADEVVLFEKATFLVISHATHQEHPDEHRYEKISNIVKQFKLGCQKTSGFGSMEVHNQQFTALIDLFTPNTYVMIILSDPNIQAAGVKLNIQAGRKRFEQVVQQAVGRSI
eukprot:g79846.t1